MRSLKLSSLLFLSLLLSAVTGLAEDRVPSRAMAYRQTIHAEVNRTWGLHVPADAYAVSAATIHQESAWNPLAQSPYAKGLTQFTDPTWADMVRRDPSIGELGDVFNAHAAIRAMTTYHHALWSLFPKSDDGTNRWAFVLSAYNGGPGFVMKDQRLCAFLIECDPLAWWDNVELHSRRASWAFKENRGYPRNILKRWLPLYSQF
jgi:hypothetical protein